MFLLRHAREACRLTRCAHSFQNLLTRRTHSGTQGTVPNQSALAPDLAGIPETPGKQVPAPLSLPHSAFERASLQRVHNLNLWRPVMANARTNANAATALGGEPRYTNSI